VVRPNLASVTVGRNGNSTNGSTKSSSAFLPNPGEREGSRDSYGRFDLLNAATARLRGQAGGIAERTGTTIELRPGTVHASVTTDPWSSGCVAAAAGSLGAPWSHLPSGGGHDAQIIARLAPTSMIFVPSIGGISHAPAEATDPPDLILGADVLLHSLLDADLGLDNRA
jgi:acetylornithine deacetylase/succinyl-diaminopimelate desuccinylase-like protein